MDEDQARSLLGAERTRVEGLLKGLRVDGVNDRQGADESGDWSDPAVSITAQGTDDVVVTGLEERLQAIDRAEGRLAEGSYGRSVQSGEPIPDDRLEADPAAELTIDEANAQR